MKWLNKENKSFSKKKKYSIKNKKEKSITKYVKESKLIPEIKNAKSFKDLIGLLQNVDNEIKLLIKKYNSKVWEDFKQKKKSKENFKQKTKKASKQKTMNPFENIPKGQAKQIDFSNIGNVSNSKNNMRQNINSEDDNLAGKWSVEKISQIGNNSQSKMPGV